MRRTVTFTAMIALAGTLSSAALAQEYAPPPANPPPAETSNTGVHAPQGLLDPTPQTRSDQLSLWAGLPFAYGFGLDVGVRFSLPLVQNGFIPKLNNSFDLEFGGDLAWYPGYFDTSLVIPYGEATVRWTFYLIPKLAVYAKTGLGLGYIITSYAGYGFSDLYLSVPFSLGVMYWVTKKLVLRAEAGGGYDYYGLRVGIGFDL
ncbi:MAG: hypothetical protein ACYDCL_21865 [Myxococcales bacterium]